MSAGDVPSGLLSRLTGWLWRRHARVEAEFGESDEDGGTNAQALKETIERKRRNELVRQREFDHLRQLRNRGIGVGRDGRGSQLSLFDDSRLAHPGERAQTLRKIDQVEARMARGQWRPAPAKTEIAPAHFVPPALSDATLPPDAAVPGLPPEDDDLRRAGFAPTVMPEAPASFGAAAPAGGIRSFAAAPLVPAAEVLADIDPDMERAALRLALGEAQAGDVAPPSAVSNAGLALSGHLCGDVDAVLATLSAGREAATLSVPCASLARVDFAAAGCLLDWARAQQARGCRVQLLDVSPSVATFLRSVGLTEHAQVVQRAP